MDQDFKKIFNHGNVLQYHDQNLQEVWSDEAYKKYEFASWDWWHLPFSTARCSQGNVFKPLTKRVESKSILEIGSAMGQAYAFLKQTGMVDLSDYTGIEVSRLGHSVSKERFPETNWVLADFSRYELDRDFDYAFERHAVHHMPEPLAQYRKIIGRTRCSVQTIFRGRLEGETISDLRKGRFLGSRGVYYLNLINLSDLINLGLSFNMNHIDVLYCGVHETISGDESADVFLDHDVQKKGGRIMRFAVRMARCGTQHAPKMNAFTKWKRLQLSPRLFQIRRFLDKLTQ